MHHIPEPTMNEKESHVYEKCLFYCYTTTNDSPLQRTKRKQAQQSFTSKMMMIKTHKIDVIYLVRWSRIDEEEGRS